MPPLYGTYEGKKFIPIHDEETKEEYLKKGYHIQRYKGLGEMDDDELKEACLDSSNRISYQVQYPQDLDQFNRIMGTSSGRRDLLKDLGLIKYIGDSVADNQEDDYINGEETE